MTSQRPIISSETNQVLPLRPRVRQPTHLRLVTAHQPPPDRVSRPGRGSRCDAAPDPTADDFRHRIVSNIAALAFTMALTALGIWLVASIAHLS